ncbi:hypothetical protein AM587_10011629 [Phytophthora nicotianae]|uniref:Uncharacterized protein n=1 Tax=Phytophthora nicotianae TaxID=4792 RepID=A0A0W8B9D8_PHYNI|nr:hypothetical protein AM587_10011629 [Phytophthora nicotianae]
MPVSPYLDEESLMAVVDDVWSLLSPSSSPIHHLKSVAGDAAVTDTANVVAAQTAVKKRKKRRPDRNRPHHEIARLRAQVAELESQLQKQTTKDTRYYTNVGLKAMLRESFDDIYALEQNLNTQMEELLRGMPRVLAAMSRNLPYDITQDDEMFAMMARSLDDQYTNMDQVLRVAGLDKITSEVADASICHSNDAIGNYGVTLKSRTCIFSPFRSDCSVGALWRHFERCQRATINLEICEAVCREGSYRSRMERTRRRWSTIQCGNLRNRVGLYPANEQRQDQCVCELQPRECDRAMFFIQGDLRDN